MLLVSFAFFCFYCFFSCYIVTLYKVQRLKALYSHWVSSSSVSTTSEARNSQDIGSAAQQELPVQEEETSKMGEEDEPIKAEELLSLLPKGIHRRKK